MPPNIKLQHLKEIKDWFMSHLDRDQAPDIKERRFGFEIGLRPNQAIVITPGRMKLPEEITLTSGARPFRLVSGLPLDKDTRSDTPEIDIPPIAIGYTEEGERGPRLYIVDMGSNPKTASRFKRIAQQLAGRPCKHNLLRHPVVIDTSTGEVPQVRLIKGHKFAISQTKEDRAIGQATVILIPSSDMKKYAEIYVTPDPSNNQTRLTVLILDANTIRNKYDDIIKSGIWAPIK